MLGKASTVLGSRCQDCSSYLIRDSSDAKFGSWTFVMAEAQAPSKDVLDDADAANVGAELPECNDDG